MTEFSYLKDALNKYPPMIDMYMFNELLKGDPEYIYKASQHLLKAGGKRLRPIIVLVTARMLGGQDAESKALPLAAAVEVFHNFTLVHDDIMDQDEFRRGVPTVHKVWGEATAILAGDLLFSLSFKAISKSSERGLSQEGLVKAFKVLTEASIRVSRGQGYDMMFEKLEEVDYHDYLQMIYLKTGALIEASAKLGAIAAGVEESIVEKLGDYGAFVGVAFQIRDDILGVFGDPEKTGKPIYNDLRRGKKTLLVLYAMKHARGEDKNLVKRVLSGSYSDGDLKRVVDIIVETGALEYAESLAEKYAGNAQRIIEDLKAAELIVDTKSLEILKELAEFSIKRDR